MLGAQWCNVGLSAAQIDSDSFGYQIIYTVNMSTYLLIAIYVRKKMDQRLVPR